MMMSPFSSSGTSSSIDASTKAAGTIRQMARGFSSFFTNSASDDAPVAPSLTSACHRRPPSGRRPRTCARRASAGAPCSRPSVRDRSFRAASASHSSSGRTRVADQSTEACRTPRDLLTRVALVPVHRLAERLLDRRVQRLEAGGHVRAQVHAQRAPLALGQHLEVAARLRRLDDRRTCTSARAPRRSFASSQVTCRKTPLLGPPL